MRNRDIVRLADKVAIVTGAGSGIGEAIAHRFAASGASVALIDISGTQDTVAVDIGERARGFKADVSDPEAMASVIGQVVEHFGRLNVVCNNAGVDGTPTMLADCPVEEFDRIMAINARGVYLGMKYALPHLVASGGGSIINVASAAGLVGQAGMASYCASKGAVIQLCRAVAAEYGAHGIRVNALCPGVIETPLAQAFLAANPQLRDELHAKHLLGRLGRAEEVAAAAEFLASDDAAFITGSVLSVDGGYTAV